MNKITLSGLVDSPLELSYEFFGEKFYKFYFSSKRLSGTVDRIPCIVSEVLAKDIVPGTEIYLEGEIRTRNTYGESEKRKHLEIKVFVKYVGDYIGHDFNKVELNGYVCKEPIYRETPSQRQICDMLIASNRNCGKSDYIPSITWGRNALRSSGFSVGDCVNLEGRLQSRIYEKRTGDDLVEMTAYELSISKIELL